MSTGETGSTSCLPPEIMTNIFILSVPEDASPSNIESPLNVSHTCRYWRDIALSSALLWSRLTLERPPDSSSDKEVRRLQVWLCVLKTWLRRSRKATLDFVIQLDVMGSDSWNIWNSLPEVHQLCRDMVELLAVEQTRWRRMELSWENLHTSPKLDLKLADMRALSSLALKHRLIDRTRLDTATVSLEIDLSSSPHIQRLDLVGVMNLEFRDIVVHNLTTLSFDLETHHNTNKCSDAFFSFLQCAPNLKHLCIVSPLVGRDDPSGRAERSESIVLPHLEVLRLINSSGPTLQALKLLTLPALADLFLGGGVADLDGVNALYALELLRRSRPPLKKFFIGDFLSDDWDLLSALKLLPILQSLSIGKRSFCYLTGAFCRGFTLDESHELCPRLQKLTLYNSAWEASEHFVNMLISRWHRCRTFQAEILCRGGTLPDGLLNDVHLKHCVDEGFVLRAGVLRD